MGTARGLFVCCALLWGHGALPDALAAQPHAEPSVTPAGLAGIDRIHLPRAQAPAVALVASAGYGFTESQGEVSGAHHRALGALGVGAAVTEWLGFALRFDGRHDVHPDDGMGVDSGTVGDPRLFARAGAALSETLQLGGEAVLWMPGEAAPSLALDASSVDLRATLAHVSAESGWTFAGQLGYRIDQSAKSAADAAELRAGDRLALEVSDFDAVLIGAGVAHRSGALELLGEVSWDVLVGGGAPSAIESPLRIAAGARYHMGALQLGLLAAVSPSARPSQDPGDRLAPIPPRFALEAGLGYRFGAGPAAQVQAEQHERARESTPPVEPGPELAVVAEPAAARANVQGRLLDADGAPLAGVRVKLTPSAGDALLGETDAEGRYTFEDVPLGGAVLSAERDGYEPFRFDIDVHEGALELSDQVLGRVPTGQLRGLAQSFGGRGIAARIRVRALEREGEAATQELQAGADGRFQLEVPPGRYEVLVTAPGYEAQSRSVKVAADQVMILNLDLRKAEP